MEIKDNYQEKFVTLKEWLPHIIETVKRDLKNEHLKRDPQFTKKYFTKPYHKVTIEDLTNGYLKAINEGEDHLGEFIFQRWLLKNTDIYQFYAQELEKISPNFAEIESIEPSRAKEISQASTQQFGARTTYIFCVVNSVQFPKDLVASLGKQALEEQEKKDKMTKENLEITNQEQLIKSFETKVKRLTDKYEKKLAGMERKYHQDVDKLKKQVADLQRKLA